MKLRMSLKKSYCLIMSLVLIFAPLTASADKEYKDPTDSSLYKTSKVLAETARLMTVGGIILIACYVVYPGSYNNR